jgi:hypothetical protein
VVILSVDDGDVNGQVGEMAGGVDTAKTTADNDDVRARTTFFVANGS